MQKLNYPLNIKFKISTLSNDFVMKDSSEQTIAYIRQKMMKLVEEIQVFSAEDRSEVLYTINANKWLDFSATYNFSKSDGKDVGCVARKGWASIWKARYIIFDNTKQNEMKLEEENPWAKVFDSILGEIPILNLLTGYFFHPSYAITRSDGTKILRLKKQPSFFGRKFTVEKLGDFTEAEEERSLLSMIMMILLERKRG